LELAAENNHVSIIDGRSLRDKKKAPDMRYVIKLGNDTVPMVWSGIPVLLMHLGREVAEDDDSWRVGAQKDRPYEQLEAFERLFVTGGEPSTNDV
jgi:hypothetical protein